MIALVWGLSVFSWCCLAVSNLYLNSTVLDGLLAGYFLFASYHRFFPRPLFLIYLTSALLQAISHFQVFPLVVIDVFINRLFEVALLYVIGASLYRQRKLRINTK